MEMTSRRSILGRHQSCYEERIAIILHETLPAYCIPKVVRMETGEGIYEKVFMSPRPHPKISLKHESKRTVSSERTGRPVVETSVIQTRSSEDSKDPNVETTHERTRRFVVEQTENVPDSCKNMFLS